MTTSADRPVVRGAAPAEAPGGSTPRRVWLAVGAVVTVLLVALAAVLLDGDGGQDRAVSPPAASARPSAGPSAQPSAAPSTPPTAGPSVAPSPAPPVPVVVDRSTAVWPVAGSAVRPATPVEAARGFATDFLGMSAPVVGTFAQGDTRSGEVPVRPTANGPVTTVLVRQLSGEQTWSVLGAATEGIELTEPAPSALLRSPVTLRGSALAFEGHVDVQVREDGRATPLGEGFVTGGGDVARPFTGTVRFSAPTTAYGSLVLLTRSAEDGSVWQASVQRARLAPGTGAQPAACGTFRPAHPALPAGSMEVAVSFTCDPGGQAVGPPFEVYRAVPTSPRVLTAALTALLAGPTTQERDGGLTSWFSPATAGLLRGVTLTDGRAIVDLRDLRTVIPGASSSAGSALLLSQLDATVFRFPTVSSVEYRIDGSCTAFTEWLQLGGCTPRTRS